MSKDSFVMQMRLLAGGCCLMIFSALAADPPAKPYRPFPEIPEVLFYEGFEGTATTFEKGKLDSEVVQTPGSHSYRLGECDWNKNDDKNQWASSTLGAVKICGGIDPNNIYVQFMMYAEEQGEINMKFKSDKYEYEKKEQVQKVKTWFPVSFKLSEMNNKGHPKADMSFSWIEIFHNARDKKKGFPKVYIDDICVTVNARPSDVLTRLRAADSKKSAVVRTIGRDGFNFTIQGNDELKLALKTVTSNRRKKPKTVLVIGARGDDAQNLVKSLNAASNKQHAVGFTFVAATAPDGGPAGGLSDLRTCLSYNIQKSEAEYAVILLGVADSLSENRGSEYVRVVLDRAIGMGCIPVLGLPVTGTLPKEKKEKVDGFNNTLTNLCGQLGVPAMDVGFAVKGDKGAFDGDELNNQGVEAAAGLAMTVLKHLDQLHK